MAVNRDTQKASGGSIVRLALQTIGRIPGGQPSIPPFMGQDSLLILNEMIDNWRTQKLLIAQLVRIEYPVSASDPYVLMGPGAQVDIGKPFSILAAAVLDVGGTSEPVVDPDTGEEILTPPLDYERPIPVYDERAFAAEGFKTMIGSALRAVYYDASYSASTGRLALGPILNTDKTIVLYALVPMRGFPDLVTEYELMPGYHKALRYNLAIQLAPLHGITPPMFVYDEARSSIGDVKRLNIRHAVLANPFGGGGHYNIYTDERQ